MSHTTGPWKFEPGTKTIRSEPANYWLATMDSWDGAVDHEANARLIAAAPDLLAALQVAAVYLRHPDIQAMNFALPASAPLRIANEAIVKATS